jgi:hypothetical protein
MNLNLIKLLLFPTSLLKSMTMVTVSGSDLGSCFLIARGAIDLATEKQALHLLGHQGAMTLVGRQVVIFYSICRS